MNTVITPKKIKKLLYIMPLSVVTGCAAFQNEPVVYDSTFGQSVNQIKQAQILNPEAAHNPPLDPPKHLDGYVGERAIQNYRTDVGERETTDTVNINLGSGGN